jgi:hypothetical protein
LDYFTGKYTRKLSLLPGMRKVFANHKHSIMNPVPTLEEEEEEEEEEERHIFSRIVVSVS